jgi:hypothetical protein
VAEQGLRQHVTIDAHNQLGNAGVYSDNLVEVAKVTAPAMEPLAGS